MRERPMKIMRMDNEDIETYLVKTFNNRRDLNYELNTYSIWNDINPYVEEDGYKYEIYLDKKDCIKYDSLYRALNNNTKTDGRSDTKIKVLVNLPKCDMREFIENIINEDGRYEIILFNINGKYNDIEIIPISEYIDKLIKNK